MKKDRINRAKETKRRKRVLCSFHYRECDSFAAYLHNMSLEGWHFVEWRAGLIFEKGEPEDVVYSVEVFFDGSEMDTRPSPETEEFAEYCEAAGWKLIDSQRKFCIFRREKETAVPIVTEEERFQNIWKAEKSKWAGRFAEKSCISLCFCLMYFGLVPIQKWIFNDIIAACVLVFLLRILIGIGEGAALFFWKQKGRKSIERGEGLVYERKKWRWLASENLDIVLILLLLLLAWEKGFIGVIILLGVVLILTLLLAVGIAILRPSRAENWIFQLGGGTLLGAALVVILVSLLVTGNLPENPSLNLDSVPLVQKDYKSIEGEITYQDAMKQKGVMGTSVNVRIDYETDNLVYTVLESRYGWVLNRIWKGIKYDSQEAEDCAQAWGAETAVRERRGERYGYYIRYSDKVVTLWCDDMLKEEEIQIIMDKLGLYE